MLWRQGARDKKKGEKKAKSWITTFCLDNFLAWYRKKKKTQPTYIQASWKLCMCMQEVMYLYCLKVILFVCLWLTFTTFCLIEWSYAEIYACVHRCLNFHMKVICWQASEVLNRITDTSQTTAFVSARQKGMWMCVLEYLHSVSDRLTEWQPSLIVSQNM